MYRMRFLGGASIDGPEGSVVGPAVQARRLAFLACLAVANGQPVSRDKLIAMLWPENAPESARHSMSNTVYVLNHELEGAPVEVVGNGLRIDTERYPSDVAEFQAAIESGDLERAVKLYGGGFLDGLFVKDALGFEEWAREERDRFARAYAQALEELAERATERGDHLQAASWRRELVAHDPLSGRATVRLMKSLAAAGDQAEALRQADVHAVRMREDFDAAPDRAVTELADQLRLASTEVTGTNGPLVLGEAKARPALVRRAWLPLVVLVTSVAVWYTTVRDAEPGPEQATALIETRGIAVLPFTVHGEAMEIWREGMVDLLSTGLDGAAGLRTISSRTLLARWREQVPDDQQPDLATVLQVASTTGARYALVGSAVAIDPDVRLIVDVYDIEMGNRLGQAQIEGAREDVLALCDRLGVEVLAVLLEKGEEEIPPIDLARVMSQSPAALKSYLEGEVHSRRFDLVDAEEAYKRAVEADSTFALAHYRLSRVYGWSQKLSLSYHHRQQAAQFVDRLPTRQALLVRNVYSAGPLRKAVERYPDDAEVWYELGEALYHSPAALAPAEDIEAAFERAIELDPQNALYLRHYVEFAWHPRGDSALAAQRLAMFERVAPSDPHGPARRLALDLAFGDSVAQSEAMTQLRSEENTDVAWQIATFLLIHPRYTALQPLFRLLSERDRLRGSNATAKLFQTTALWYGRLRDALPYLDDPSITVGLRAYAAYRALVVGLPIPEETLEQALDPALIDSMASRLTLFYVSAFAADRGHWPEHARAIAELQRREELSRAEADSIVAEQFLGAVRALEGYALWRRGEPTAALAMLEDPLALNYPWRVVRLWLGQIYQELGRLRDAERVYRSYEVQFGELSTKPLSRRELGKIYEELEEYDRAVKSYEYFVEYWQDADPELQPMVAEARQAIARLKELSRE